MDSPKPLDPFLTSWIAANKLKSNLPYSNSPFYRNLEEALDVRRQNSNLFTLWQSNSTGNDRTADFTSNDILSLGSSGIMRSEFLKELAENPGFLTGAGGSRLLEGNSAYHEAVEQEAADLHGAECALIVGSGYEANVAIWMAVPRPGDVIIYDQLVHASTREGMRFSLATEAREFKHNDVESFKITLRSVRDSQALIRQGERSVLVGVESIYSMDGDICPLDKLVQAADAILPGLVHFVVDEAHSTGVIGPKGTGLVCQLKLEHRIAVRLHTFGKALSASGAVVLGNNTIKLALLNFAKGVIFSTAPAFPAIAAMRAGIRLMSSGRIQDAQRSVQTLVASFFEAVTSHPLWEEAQALSIISVPLTQGWQDRGILTHIIPIMAKRHYIHWLYFHMSRAGFSTAPVTHPVVPLGEDRLRITIHAGNTRFEIENLVQAIFIWVEEMIQIVDHPDGHEIPAAARPVYSWMVQEEIEGFGMV